GGDSMYCYVFFQSEDGIRDFHVNGVQTCALPIWARPLHRFSVRGFTAGLPIEGRAWGRRGTRRHFAFSILTTLRDQNMTFRETTSRCLLRTFSTSRKS